MLAVFEPLMPTNKSIERNWSPVWSLWRPENNATTGAASQSLLWNLYRREQSPDPKNARYCSVFSSIRTGSRASVCRLFYVPLGKGSPGR